MIESSPLKSELESHPLNYASVGVIPTMGDFPEAAGRGPLLCSDRAPDPGRGRGSSTRS
ncbi:hypothetical protein SDC9_85202 [bioreactor metagenome]|uniref:Uncharacterized protein n=1 Tax=bioreactor metagenome TaxID=1076179 RepID=A0A644ZIP9_9ZZZZ